MHFFGCLFALLLGIFFIAIAFIGNVIDLILSLLGLKKRIRPGADFGGFGGQRTSYGSQSSSDNQRSQQQAGQQHSDQQSTGRQTQKIFEKDDSEYVDFEEV